MIKYGVDILFEPDGMLNSIYLVSFDSDLMSETSKKTLRDYEKDGRNVEMISIRVEYFYYGVTFGWGFPPSEDDRIINKESNREIKETLEIDVDKVFKSKNEAFNYVERKIRNQGNKNIETAIMTSLLSEKFK